MSGIAKAKFREKNGSTPWKETNTRERWLYLEKLVQEGFFDEADLHFARFLEAKNESEAAFIIFLFKNAREGHLLLREDAIQGIHDPNLKELVIVGSQSKDIQTHFSEENSWSFPVHQKTRTVLFSHLSRLLKAPCKLSFDTAIFSDLSIEQRKACDYIQKQNVSFICGGPGTGKTFLATRLIIASHAKQIVVATPTGKAAANIRNRLQDLNKKIEISTLHSLLKVGRGFPENPFLRADLILVDEASMIDARLFVHLLASIKTGAACVFFGDAFQLPPVLPGSFFPELTEKFGFYLEECRRTDLLEILQLAKKIKEGDSDGFFAHLEKNNENIFLKALPEKEELLLQVAKQFDEVEDFFSEFNERRILTPLRKGPFGVLELAEDLSFYLSEREEFPIMITANDSHLGLYNGDIGIIRGERVHFASKETLPSLMLPSFEPAYFLSVHKSQGSEVDEVHVLLPEGSEAFGKQMLYTAVTRARKKVYLYGKRETLRKIIEKDGMRHSGIKEKLRSTA